MESEQTKIWREAASDALTTPRAELLVYETVKAIAEIFARLDALEAPPQPSGNTGELTETAGKMIAATFKADVNAGRDRLAAAIDAAVKEEGSRFDNYMRSLAESAGCNMASYDEPAASGNNRLRWAVLIQKRIEDYKARAENAEAEVKLLRYVKGGGA